MRDVNFRELRRGEVRRTHIPRTPVNKGKREGPGPLAAPALFLATLFYQSTYSLKVDDHAVF
jgi:hypothetical protein